MKTANVKWLNNMVKAYSDDGETVRVWDSLSGYYVRPTTLTPNQIKRVIRLTYAK